MKEMKRLFGLVLGYSLVTAFPFAQDRSTPVSLIELIAHVEKFDNQLVTVQGFLRITHERKHGVRANLYLHEEDAKNLLNNYKIIQRPSIQGVDEALYLRPRTIGITAAYEM